MNLSCCICIFILTHFVFGSSNENKSSQESIEKKVLQNESSLDDSVVTDDARPPLSGVFAKYGGDSVAVDEPDLNNEAADEDADKNAIEGAVKENEGENLSISSSAQTSCEQIGSEDDSNSSGTSIKKLTGESYDKTNVLPFWNGIVPYYIDRESYDKIIVGRIVAATKVIEKESCIKFVHLNDRDKADSRGKYYLHIINPDKKRECVHSVERGNDGEPTLILGYDCMQPRDIIHALMHLLGFGDEVTHPLRDSYIRVLWENIQPKYRHLFAIKKLKKYHEVGEYDMMSIMHFHPSAYSINGAPTVVPLMPGGLIMPSDKLSVLDKMKLRLAFRHECNRRKVSKLLGTCINSIQGDNTAVCSGGSENDNGADSESPKPGKSSGSHKDKSGGSSDSDRCNNLIESSENKKKALSGTDKDRIEALTGTDKDRIENLSGTDKDKTEALCGTDKDRIEALSGTDKDKTESLCGTDKDRIEALSETDKDRIEALSGTDKDRRETLILINKDRLKPLTGTGIDDIKALSGTEKDRRETLTGINKDRIKALTGTDKDRKKVLAGTGKNDLEALIGSDRDNNGGLKKLKNKAGFKGNNELKDILKLTINKINKKKSSASYLHSYKKHMY